MLADGSLGHTGCEGNKQFREIVESGEPPVLSTVDHGLAVQRVIHVINRLAGAETSMSAG